MVEFSTIDISKILRIDRARFRGWADTKLFIEPSVQLSKGRGYKALYSYLDLLSIAVFQYLITVEELPRKRAVSIMRAAQGLLNQCGAGTDFADYLVVTSKIVVNSENAGAKIFEYELAATKVDLLECNKKITDEPWLFQFIVNLHQIKTYIDRRIKEIG